MWLQFDLTASAGCSAGVCPLRQQVLVLQDWWGKEGTTVGRGSAIEKGTLRLTFSGPVRTQLQELACKVQLGATCLHRLSFVYKRHCTRVSEKPRSSSKAPEVTGWCGFTWAAGTCSIHAWFELQTVVVELTGMLARHLQVLQFLLMPWQLLQNLRYTVDGVTRPYVRTFWRLAGDQCA